MSADAGGIGALFANGSLTTTGNVDVGGAGALLGGSGQIVLSVGGATVPFSISYTGDSATNSPTGGNDIALLVTRVPEPGVSLLAAIGCSLLGTIRPRPIAYRGTRVDAFEKQPR